LSKSTATPRIKQTMIVAVMCRRTEYPRVHPEPIQLALQRGFFQLHLVCALVCLKVLSSGGSR
jgi:hypothetical protein